ncbi:hypothetical protein A2W14_06445 [Candidatus Gottesmanbacteria bacterium RBG_16_37_8]|uniref:R3H domain-containing protein n=1 Tax=Candidatus Gottesmanbacteria bacterium RBG_16_37_8 TaxID=1798371 RepID=A0A1F5YRP8_9BACT|nr:MAG: hypothetical protein A2W14_06445 [Candidatus Gottesmanbacteria bacterium RBG_16_37_8]
MNKKTESKPRSKKVRSNKYLSEIEKTVSELLEKLTVEAKVEVREETGEDKEEQVKHFRVNIETTESGLLIGHHGETINSLQLLVGVILYKKFKEWVRVIIDVGDYRKMREESIREMVNRIAAEVEQTGRPVELPYLSPLERRLVHMMLSEHEKVMSESQGEGKDRRVTIKPR